MIRLATLPAALLALVIAAPAAAQAPPPAAPPVAAPLAPTAAPKPAAPPTPAPPAAPAAPAAPVAEASPVEPVEAAAATPPAEVPATRVTLAEEPRRPARQPALMHYELPAPVDAPPPPPLPAPRGPVESLFEVALHLDSTWHRDQGFDLFSSDDVAQNTGFGVAYAVWTDGPLALAPELTWGHDEQSSSGLLGGAVTTTRLDTDRYAGGLRLRYALLSFLEPALHLVAGATSLDTSVSPRSGSASLEQTDWSAFGRMGLGVTVRTASRALETRSGNLASLVFGLQLEGGYHLQPSVELAPTPAHPSRRIQTSEARLGSLGRSGGYAEASLLVRF